MKHMRLTHLIVLLAAAMLLVFIAGCPKAPTDGGEVMPDVTPPDVSDAGATVPIPDSVATLGEAMASFNMPGSFQMTVQEGDKEPESILMKMEGAKAVAFKAESDEGIVIVSMADKAMYLYNPEENSALKMPMDDEDGADMPNPYEFYEDDLKVTGSETIDGVDCWVVDGPAGEDAPGTAWIGKADGLMRQAKDGDNLIKITYDRIDEIPDSEFALPEGAKVEEFNMEGLGAPAPAPTE